MLVFYRKIEFVKLCLFNLSFIARLLALIVLFYFFLRLGRFLIVLCWYLHASPCPNISWDMIRLDAFHAFSRDVSRTRSILESCLYLYWDMVSVNIDLSFRDISWMFQASAWSRFILGLDKYVLERACPRPRCYPNDASEHRPYAATVVSGTSKGT
jgi:hypothetical protein